MSLDLTPKGGTVEVPWRKVRVNAAFRYEGELWRKVTATHGKHSRTGQVSKPLPGKINQSVFEVDCKDVVEDA